MKKTGKAGARRVTRSVEPSTSKGSKRTAKSRQKKQSISGQQQQREKERAGAETGASVSNMASPEIFDKFLPSS
jgi:hypothetical protein